MSLEKGVRSRILRILKPLDGQAIERNLASPGTPDVCYADGLLELKSVHKYPVRESTVVRVRHFTPIQRTWITRRWFAGGHIHLLLKIAEDWYLFDGLPAAEHVGRVDRAELSRKAKKVWLRNLQEDELFLALEVGNLSSPTLNRALRSSERGRKTDLGI